MPADPNTSDLMEIVAQQLREAYQRGFAAGAAAMRDNILAAATATPGAPAGVSESPNVYEQMRRQFADGVQKGIAEHEDKRRAPRGLIQGLIREILSDGQALTQAEIEDRIEMLDNRVARKSVYNHLNTNRDGLYVYDLGKWSLKAPAKKETAEVPSPDTPAADLLTRTERRWGRMDPP